MIEVEKQAGAMTAHAEVGQELGFMDGQDAVDRLDLNHQLAVDKEIQAKCGFQLHALVDNGQLDLALEDNPSLKQFMAEAVFVDAFQKAGAELSVHLDRTADDALGQRNVVHLLLPCLFICASVSLW